MTAPGKKKFQAILSLAILSLAVLAGCGGGDDGTSDDEAAVKTSMVEWAKAETPAETCAHMASGFLFFVGDGDPDKCKDRVVKVIGKKGAANDVEVHSVAFEDGQAKANATVDGQKFDFWFIEQDGEWLLNSIGLRQGKGPDPDDPPPAPDEGYQAPPQ